MSSDYELGLLLKEVVRLNRHLGGAMAEDLGVHVSDFEALDELFSDGPMGPVELGRRLRLGSAAATALADRLERAGHVERHPHPDDRRRIVLVPTEQAGTSAMGVLEPFIRDLATLSAHLSEHDRGVVASFLHDVLDIYRRHLKHQEPTA